MTEPIPIPNRFSTDLIALQAAQSRAEQTTSQGDKESARRIARRIIGQLSTQDDRRFAAAIHFELAAALILGCPSVDDLEEAADVLGRGLEPVDRTDPRLVGAVALFSHVSLLLAVAKGDKSRLRAAIAAADLGSSKATPESLPLLIETMMALSFVRRIDPDLVRLSVDDPQLFGLATIEAENRAISAMEASRGGHANPKVHIASARIHTQFCLHQKNLNQSDRADHAGFALMALSRVPFANEQLLRRDIPFGVVLAASAVSVLLVCLYLAVSEVSLPNFEELIHGEASMLANQQEFSPESLTATIRRLVRIQNDVAATIGSRLLSHRVPQSPRHLELEPLLRVIDEHSDRSLLNLVVGSMWVELVKIADEMRALLDK